jgi:opacity protein-like surface antigen
LSGSVVRQISDGGGLGGAVQMTDFTAALTRKAGKAWNLNLTASYTLNGSNTGPTANSFSYLNAGAGVSRTIHRNISIDAQYFFIHQDQTSAIPLTTLPLPDHNRVSIGLRYRFSTKVGI